MDGAFVPEAEAEQDVQDAFQCLQSLAAVGQGFLASWDN
jgi:hypothetical protein